MVPGQVIVDPSRAIAQIVNGAVLLGAALIFGRGDSVRSLTTAASIWVTVDGTGAGAGFNSAWRARRHHYSSLPLPSPKLDEATAIVEPRLAYESLPKWLDLLECLLQSGDGPSSPQPYLYRAISMTAGSPPCGQYLARGDAHRRSSHGRSD